MRNLQPLLFAFGCSFFAAELLAEAPPSPAGDRITVSAQTASLVRDGKVSALRKEIKLTNGTTVKPDGQILRPDGTPLTLGTGEWLDVDGTVCDGARPAAAPSTPKPDDVANSAGTESTSQAGADLGAAEAKRRTKAAIDEAIVAAPTSAAK
jgi:hypothetical protein